METKNCQNCKKDFTIDSEDFSFYERMKVPPPTFCPLCRAERRFTFRNEKILFKAKDHFTGQEIFSLYPEESNRKIITHEEWYSDQWDGMEYGIDYDFSKSFFEQFIELEKSVPVLASRVQKMVNSPYSSNATGLKNCYLCFASSLSENCMYSINVDESKDCIDNSHISNSERCYECFWTQGCYQCYFTIMSVESNNLWFCRDCIGCNDCLGCANLHKASYCIFNKQYTKENYEKEIEKIKLDTISGILSTREKARNFWLTQPLKSHQGLRNISSTGSYVTNCKNVNDCYMAKGGENLKYCQYLYVQIPTNKECYDTNNWGNGMELHYETCMCGDHTYNIKFSANCWPNCKNIEYCMNLFSCSDCFGCVGLKKKQYCVFNKQYSKEEYESLVEKIKDQMTKISYTDKKGNVYKYGEFFPIEFCPFGYNNTLAIQHFDVNKEKAKEIGYPWMEVEKGQYSITKKITELPKLIKEVDKNIVKEIIECQNCKSPYRILEDELAFYKKENLPIPNLCNECRQERRIADRLKVYLYDKKCMCVGEKDQTGKYQNTTEHSHGNTPCQETFKTGYSPERSEIVYCEKCYKKEVY